jgi:hypothetical protein
MQEDWPAGAAPVRGFLPRLMWIEDLPGYSTGLGEDGITGRAGAPALTGARRLTLGCRSLTS